MDAHPPAALPGIFDSDRHVSEPLTLWRRYLPRALHDHLPYLSYEDPSDPRPLHQRMAYRDELGEIAFPPHLVVDGRPVMSTLSDTTRAAMLRAAAARQGDMIDSSEPAGQLAALDREGIAAALLLPTYAAYLVSVDDMDSALAHAFGRAYNDWLRDFCAADPARLRGVGLMARHDPARMVEEVRRVADFGWRAVILRPNPVGGRLLGDAAYEPFWAACEQCALTVIVHEGAHTRLPTVGSDRFTSRFAQHACSHPMEQMMALLSLIESGVLERHPRLQVVFMEAGVGWLPYWLWRLDEVEYRHLKQEVGHWVRMPPSDYFRRQCHVTIEADEPLLAETIDWLGADRVLFGSDFPHVDHEGAVGETVADLGRRLPRAALEELLWENPVRLFGPG